MRQIKDLIQDKEKVWIYLSTDEVARRFIKQAVAEGFHWSNGEPLTEDTKGFLFGVHQDMSIAHLAMYIWCMAFQCHGNIPGTPMCIDYEKYINGELDYICHEPHIKGYMTE